MKHKPFISIQSQHAGVTMSNASAAIVQYKAPKPSVSCWYPQEERAIQTLFDFPNGMCSLLQFFWTGFIIKWALFQLNTYFQHKLRSTRAVAATGEQK